MMWDLSGGAQTTEHRHRHGSHSRSRSQSQSYGTPAFPAPFNHSQSYGSPAFPVPQSGSHSTAFRPPSPHPLAVSPGPALSAAFPGYTASDPFLSVPNTGVRGFTYNTPKPSRQRHNSTSALYPPAFVQPRPHSSSGHTRPPPAGHNRPSHTRHHSHSPQPPYFGQTALPPVTHPAFQYSACTGRKKALCIGINYRGHPNELRGCINDAKNVRNFLIRHAGYKEEDIVLLSDDHGSGSRQIPTRDNILDAMRWLVKGARPHDSLFFHYSGHGGQTRDLDGDEVDGYDEVIFPLDHKKRGHIVDDLMHSIMVKPLPSGCRLTALFDSCHSGTALDLPYIYSSTGRLKGSNVSSRARARKATPADVISWAACKDSQNSADTFANGQAVGVMSYAFMSCLKKNPGMTYQELLLGVRDLLKKKYSQKPQLGSSHQIDIKRRFIL